MFSTCLANQVFCELGVRGEHTSQPGLGVSRLCGMGGVMRSFLEIWRGRLREVRANLLNFLCQGDCELFLVALIQSQLR